MTEYSPLFARRVHPHPNVLSGQYSNPDGLLVLAQEADVVPVLDASGRPRMLGEGAIGQVWAWACTQQVVFCREGYFHRGEQMRAA